MPNNLWSGYFDDPLNPFGREQAYFSYGNQWRSPNMKKYFQQQFGNIQNQYMGQLGSLVRAGGAPSLNFSDFLSNYNWGQQFQEQAPQQDFSRYNPFTRWLLG